MVSYGSPSRGTPSNVRSPVVQAIEVSSVVLETKANVGETP